MNLKLITRRLILFFLYFLAVSCNDEEVSNPPIVESGLEAYVNRFLEEAELRGKTISLNNLEVRFADLQNTCGTGSVDPLRVNIDEDCWNALPDVAKEILMFHELGHSILRRDHDASILPNGDYKSIMYNDPTTLYNEYTPQKRTYYLDELFGVVTNLPAWTSAKTIASTIIADDISNGALWKYSVSGNANHEGSIVDTAFSSPSNSLAIHSEGGTAGYSYWSYSWSPQDIEEGSTLVLKVKIKTVGLTGGGAYFAFRADVNEKDYPIFFYTTQGEPVLGTAEFGSSEYSIQVNYFPSKADKLNIYLILDGTSSGTVFFDDIELLKYQ